MKKLFLIFIILLMATSVYADKVVTIGGSRATYPIVNADGVSSSSSYAIPTEHYVDTKPVYVSCEIEDVSTAQSDWAIAPVNGTISKVWTVIDGTITLADSNITVELAGSPIASGCAISSGSTAGTVDSVVPTRYNTVTAGQAIEVITDGGSTGTVKTNVLIQITPSDS